MKSLSSFALPSSSRWACPSVLHFGSIQTHLRDCRQPLRHALLVGSAALLVACGGGGGDGGVGGGDVGDGSARGDPDLLSAPAGISLGAATIKTLNFQWAAVPGAKHYKLFEDLDGAGSEAVPVELGVSPITASHYEHEVPLYERLNASYTIKACNDSGCGADSSAFRPSLADLNAAIGYAKATGGGAEDDQYGVAVALSKDGKTLAVGTVNEGVDNSGAVYVMRHTSAGQWSPPQRLKDAGVHADENFGRSLALSANGSVLAVGIPFNSIAGVASGAVRMFVFNPATQVYGSTNVVTATNAEASDEFGWAVSLSDDGNVLAVGAPREDSSVGFLGVLQPDSNSDSDSGAVYVYRRISLAGSWTDPQFIKASNASGLDNGDQFGRTLALSGDGLTLAVGAHLEDSSGISISDSPSSPILSSDNAQDSGAVYVFSRQATKQDFGNQVYIKASNASAGDFFGGSVALSENGSVLAVGAHEEDSSAVGINGVQTDDGSAGSGAVYVFARDQAGLWSQQAYLKASNNSVQAYFGWALALTSDGNTLAVGARQELRTGLGLGAELQAGEGAISGGAVYLFLRGVSGAWSQSAYLKSPSDPSGQVHAFGSALALSGDGRSLAVGDPWESHSEAAAANPKAGAPALGNGSAMQAGAVYLF